MRRRRRSKSRTTPKRKTHESWMKLKFFNCNFVSCDFQILDNFLHQSDFVKFPWCEKNVFLYEMMKRVISSVAVRQRPDY